MRAARPERLGKVAVRVVTRVVTGVLIMAIADIVVDTVIVVDAVIVVDTVIVVNANNAVVAGIDAVTDI